jgi:hypothetical protein
MDEHDRDDDSGADRLRRARRGDEAAFESIYREHARAIHALALRLTGSPAAAEDITQDTFLRMFGFLSGLREDTPLRPWLKRVAVGARSPAGSRTGAHGSGSFDKLWRRPATDPVRAGVVHVNLRRRRRIIRAGQPVSRTR